MTYKIFITPESELDLEDAYNWYEQHTVGLGSEFRFYRSLYERIRKSKEVDRRIAVEKTTQPQIEQGLG
jgi:hypothetical protein